MSQNQLQQHSTSRKSTKIIDKSQKSDDKMSKIIKNRQYPKPSIFIPINKLHSQNKSNHSNNDQTTTSTTTNIIILKQNTIEDVHFHRNINKNKQIFIKNNHKNKLKVQLTKNNESQFSPCNKMSQYIGLSSKYLLNSSIQINHQSSHNSSSMSSNTSHMFDMEEYAKKVQKKQQQKYKAYDWFNRNKQKQYKISKQQRYLLPKISEFKITNKNISSTSTNHKQNKIKNKQVKHFSISDNLDIKFNNNKQNVSKSIQQIQSQKYLKHALKEDNHKFNVLRQFRDKCKEEINKLTFNLSQPNKKLKQQYKRFFDFSQTELNQILNESLKQVEVNLMKNESGQPNNRLKFRQLHRQEQSQNISDPSIPPFLRDLLLKNPSRNYTILQNRIKSSIQLFPSIHNSLSNSAFISKSQMKNHITKLRC